LIGDHAAVETALEQFTQPDLAIERVASPSTMSAAQDHQNDVVVLIRASGESGVQSCQTIRRDRPRAGVLVVDSTGERAAVDCLRAGADDWVPVSTPADEIQARIEAMFRRLEHNARVLRIGDLELNVDRRTARRGQKSIPLTNREYVLLEYMMRRPNTVLSRAEISRNVWNAPEDAGSNVIDVYVSMLRRKIDKGFSSPLIRTIVGSGYVLGETQTQSPQ
jgi:two-component system copper resistance phosphate regulon response regulator CusR